jgi:hypothetical protein
MKFFDYLQIVNTALAMICYIVGWWALARGALASAGWFFALGVALVLPFTGEPSCNSQD